MDIKCDKVKVQNVHSFVPHWYGREVRLINSLCSLPCYVAMALCYWIKLTTSNVVWLQ